MILRWYNVVKLLKHNSVRSPLCKALSTVSEARPRNEITLFDHKYPTDEWTNISTNVISKLGSNLHVTPFHPLSHVRQRIVNYFYMQFSNRIGNPIFSVYDNISPIVTVAQNFDSLLVPSNHPSRQKNDCYYINQDTLLRAHTSAHQAELISMGLNNFLVIGDVYRRDEIDNKHYPVFHQADGVRLCTVEEVFERTSNSDDLKLFEHRGVESNEKQACHTLESVKIMEHELKNTLTGLARILFGPNIQTRWIGQYFPFTYPSWELEVYHNNQWLEILGCGIMRQEILTNSGVTERIGWAFGLGLERLAMCLYNIPDIRLFWSKDSGFLSQFEFNDPNKTIEYKPVSVFPQCTNDVSFWLPVDGSYSKNDFYDLVRNVGGDRVEQILLKDVYVHPVTKRNSHCYTIVYRHMNRTLSKREVNNIHNLIKKYATEKLRVEIR
ncbi:probable phenylalanine--tRNA ligase, mitochondrial [Colletes gigas]|uniref:probable phenylalanine--tRNA ligase, mitochondrial n=1 Tax=Colletes gigas TaxID=935657 RepID=UPI001C9B3EA0|nr:probable phenylalanine--tRNA ligase, mitochondrial [Colletes gigas]